MQAPALSVHEPRRLQTLRSLNLLDTDPEERFDRITRIAKSLFEVPIALITLIDEERQWFKSAQGIRVRETPRALSFCGHAILEERMLVVSDAEQDFRFADNPLVTGEPKIRFYAGCPLVADGSALGTLCVIDRNPRGFSDDQRLQLEDLARMAEHEFAKYHLATADELTGLANRRGFTAIGQHALNVCHRDSKQASLLFFDLDQFKAINDQFGHAEGDQALVAFAQLLRKVFRISDVVARLSGDEFLVLMVNPGETGTEEALGRLASATAAFNQASKRGYELRFSVGLSSPGPSTASRIEDLIDEADRQMYLQKNSRKQASTDKPLTPSRRLWRVLTTPI